VEKGVAGNCRWDVDSEIGPTPTNNVVGCVFLASEFVFVSICPS
jgi:hypothetical protein